VTLLLRIKAHLGKYVRCGRATDLGQVKLFEKLGSSQAEWCSLQGKVMNHAANATHHPLVQWHVLFGARFFFSFLGFAGNHPVIPFHFGRFERMSVLLAMN
jgi:hypothetical protein